MLHKRFVCRPEIGPKHFDKLKPKPGPTRKARPDLQLCFSNDCARNLSYHQLDKFIANSGG